jgi:hypothetical protein
MRPLPNINRYLEANPYQKRKIRDMYEARGSEKPHALKGRPSPLKGTTRPNLQGKRGPYPHKWKSGPDPIKHAQFIAWHRQRSQAIYRGEEYTLTYEEFMTLWADKWQQRGRKIDDYCLSRRNPALPWDINNTILITRREHLTKPRK